MALNSGSVLVPGTPGTLEAALEQGTVEPHGNRARRGRYHECEHSHACGHCPVKEFKLVKMPNSDRAVVDMRKLRDYCLNLQHPRGRHKARRLQTALGYTALHAAELQAVLFAAARSEQAVAGDQDEYGQRYHLDVVVTGPAGQATVRSAWIVRREEDFPRLTSCYVL